MRLTQITVEEYTSPCPITVGPYTTIKDLISLFEEKGIRHIPVLDKGEIVGIVSQRNVTQVYKHLDEGEEIFAKDVMIKEPLTVYEQTPLEEVAFLMSENKIGSVLVLDQEGKLSGIFTSTDALNSLFEIIRGDFELSS